MGFNVCDGSFRSELSLPNQQTSTWHITQVMTVPWVYAVCAVLRHPVTRFSDGETASPWKAVIKETVAGWTSWSWLFSHAAEHMWFCYKRRTGLLSTITTYNRSKYMILPWCRVSGGPARCWDMRIGSKNIPKCLGRPICRTRWNSFGLYQIHRHTFVWEFHTKSSHHLSNLRKDVFACGSQRS